MKIKFFKYQGAGNDFIMIDDRSGEFPQSKELIEKICDRHFGVGGDGLILLQNHEEANFGMIYFNSDGREGSMCGNGGRCIVRFAENLGIIQSKTEFMAVDGLHEATIEDNLIHLKMSDINQVEEYSNHIFLNTGSPHHVEFVEDTQTVNVKEKGSKIRYGSPYFEEGSNVNFVEVTSENSLRIRTYERGVEDETLACGTGITAAAIAATASGRVKGNEIEVDALGGDLKVKFTKGSDGSYKDVWLTGPAEFVFEGVFETER